PSRHLFLASWQAAPGRGHVASKARSWQTLRAALGRLWAEVARDGADLVLAPRSGDKPESYSREARAEWPSFTPQARPQRASWRWKRSPAPFGRQRVCWASMWAARGSGLPSPM